MLDEPQTGHNEGSIVSIDTHMEQYLSCLSYIMFIRMSCVIVLEHLSKALILNPI